MKFNDLADATSWRAANRNLIASVEAEATAVEGVHYTDVCLCGNCPSYIAGLSADDQELVCFPL